MENSMQANCLNCSNSFVAQRNPNQKYCRATKCQNLRKAIWRRQKLKSDSDYRENRNNAAKNWRTKNSGYWKNYRTKKRQSEPENIVSKINASLFAKNHANSDALQIIFILKAPIESGTYRLIAENDYFANSDA